MRRRVDLDAWDWFEPGGVIPRGPAERRRRALLVARCIEYGGRLEPGAWVSTLISCQRRPDGKRCRGMLEVGKEVGDALFARCLDCGGEAARIRGWEDTPWAAGPTVRHEAPAELQAAAPHPPKQAGGCLGGEISVAARERPLGDEGTSIPDAIDRQLERVLGDMESSLDAATVRRHIALARSPSKVVEIVAGSGAIPDEGLLEELCDVLIDAWNHTPRAELGGRTPAQMSRAMAMPADAARLSARAEMAKSVATDAPCLCGSGAPAAQCCAPQFH
jgi:hypothetical protein